MNRARVLPVFSIIFIIAYAVALYYNLPVFIYYPTVNEFHFAAQPNLPGPPMYYYGWLSTAALCAIVVSALAAVLPLKTERWWPGLPWVAALGAVALVVYVNRVWFIH